MKCKKLSVYKSVALISLAVLTLFLCLCVVIQFATDRFIKYTQQEVSNVPSMVSVALTPEDAERLYQNLNLRKEEALQEIPGIGSMDISQDGKFLLATKDSIWVLERDFSPQSQISLTVNSAFYVLWNGENILIILERGEDCIEITQQGDLAGAYKISTADSRNESFFQAIRSRNMWKIGIDSYRLERAPGLLCLFAKGGYSRLIVTRADGQTEILLDTTKDLWKSAVFFVVVVSVGLVLVTAVIVLKIRHI
jgi:hypothetical protein